SARSGATSLLDASALRRVVTTHVSCHDLSELAVPLTVTTTCLDCATAVHHASGPVADTLVASCALPGLLPPVRLPDGHLHVDGGVVCGVPLDAAMAVAAPGDRVLVLDCGLAPVTSGPDCAAGPGSAPAGCALGSLEPRSFVAPVDRVHRALDPVLRSFTAARAVASAATVRPFLADQRVEVLPHVADAYAAGLLVDIPRGTRDPSQAAALVSAGRSATLRWLAAGERGQGTRSQAPAVHREIGQAVPGQPDQLGEPA
ncbi:MAG: patatin-like phospholipase family protein, partial [Actinobacteria bacterium]|nr:patatin-like phospholipase family protein [Actinomycetota bacterium]